MSQEAYPDFTAFGALSKAFSVLTDNISFFAVMMLVMIVVTVAPSQIYYDNVDLADPVAMMEQMSADQPMMIAFGILSVIFYTIYAIIVIDRTHADVNRISFDDYPYVSRSLSKVVPMIILYIIIGIMAGIGFLFLVIPGLIILSMFYLAIPAMLAENIGIFAALGRSKELSKGCRLGISGVILIPYIPLFLISFWLLGVMVGEISQSQDLNAAFAIEYQLLSAVLNALAMTYMMIVAAVSYHMIAKQKIS